MQRGYNFVAVDVWHHIGTLDGTPRHARCAAAANPAAFGYQVMEFWPGHLVGSFKIPFREVARRQKTELVGHFHNVQGAIQLAVFTLWVNSQQIIDLLNGRFQQLRVCNFGWQSLVCFHHDRLDALGAHESPHAAPGSIADLNVTVIGASHAGAVKEALACWPDAQNTNVGAKPCSQSGDSFHYHQMFQFQRV